MSEDLDLFKHEFSKNIPNAYLLKRKNITYFNSIIISATKLTYFKKYSFFGDKTTIERFKRIIKSWLTSDKNKIIIEKGIWFTDHKSHVYFHWLMDSLQRAEISFEYQKEYPLLLPEELYEKPFVVERLFSNIISSFPSSLFIFLSPSNVSNNIIFLCLLYGS